MPAGTDPIDVYHNGTWYSRGGVPDTTGYVRLGQTRTALVIGDSIGAQGINGGESGTFGASYVPYARTVPRGWWWWANVLAGSPLDILDVRATGGAACAAILAQANAYTGATPDWLLFNGGVNDISNGADADDLINDIQAIYQWAEGRGCNVLRLGITPVNSSQSYMVGTTRQRIARIRRWEMEYCRKHGHLYIDPLRGDVVGDPTLTTGNERTGAFYDSIAHPSIKGAYWIGKEGAALMLASGYLASWRSPGELPISAAHTAQQGDVSLTSITGNGTTATVVTAATHYFKVGEKVNVRTSANYSAGAAGNQLDLYGTKTILSVADATHFTYSCTFSGSGTGTMTASAGLNLNTNPVMQGTGGNSTGTTGTITATDPIPDNVNIVSSAVGVTATVTTPAHTKWSATPGSTTAADYDGGGDWLNLAITATTAGSVTVSFDGSSAEPSTAMLTRRIHGGDYFSEAEIEVHTLASGVAPRVYLEQVVSSGPANNSATVRNLVTMSDGLPGASVTDDGPSEAWKGVLRTPKFAAGWVDNYITSRDAMGTLVQSGHAGINSSTSNYAYNRVVINFQAAGVCQVRIGRVGFIRDVNDLAAFD